VLQLHAQSLGQSHAQGDFDPPRPTACESALQRVTRLEPRSLVGVEDSSGRPLDCASLHEQCGGTNWKGRTCCVKGTECVKVTESKWYCRDTATRGDTEVRFEGEQAIDSNGGFADELNANSSNNPMQYVEGDYHRRAYRPLWPKSLRCDSESDDSCGECDFESPSLARGIRPGDNCWRGDIQDGSEIKVVTQLGTTWTRYVHRLHFQCDSKDGSFIVMIDVDNLDLGTLNLYLDGTAVSAENQFNQSLDCQITFPLSSGVEGINEVKTNMGARCHVYMAKLHVDKNTRGHELDLVFRPTPHSPHSRIGFKESVASVSNYQLYMTDGFMQCQDHKVGLLNLASQGLGGQQLRSRNYLQWLCLEADDIYAVKELTNITMACEVWRTGLTSSARQSLLSLLAAANLQGTSLERVARLARMKPPRSAFMIDRSIGVESFGGVVPVFFPPNTVAPAEATQVLTTGVNDQKAVSIKVVDGGDRREIGRLILQPLEPKPRFHLKIEVYMKLSHDGTLLVRASEMSSGTINSTIIHMTFGPHAMASALLETKSNKGHPGRRPSTKPLADEGDTKERCIYPPTEDPLAWDCDCYEDAQARCESIRPTIESANEIPFVFSDCLRANFCLYPRVCEHWKTEACGDAITSKYMSALNVNDEETTMRASILRRSSAGPADSDARSGVRSIEALQVHEGRRGSMDKTLSGKSCV